MDLGLNEAQQMLKTTAQDFLSAECPDTYVREMEEDERGYTPELWTKIAEQGLLGLIIPEQYGGVELEFQDLVVLLEEMGRYMLPGPFFSTVVLGGMSIMDAGSDEQKQEYLPRIAEGQIIMTLALTEPSARWDAAGVELTAKPNGDSYSLNGTKLFVPNAHVSDYMVVVARTGSSVEDISLFVVPTQRTQFGRPIGSFQAIQHHCANMATDVEGSKFITYQAAWRLSEGLPADREVAMAKAWVSDAYRRVCALGHQSHGAIGFTKEHNMQLYSRRAKASEIMFGDTDFHLENVANIIGL